MYRLPIKNTYTDNRHTSSDYANNTDFKIDLPINSTLPSNTAYYVTYNYHMLFIKHTVRLLWYAHGAYYDILVVCVYLVFKYIKT